MLNQYTNQEATIFFEDHQPSYGYHTTIYESGEFHSSRFSIDIKEYKSYILIEANFIGSTPNGSAGPHGFALTVIKHRGDWKGEVKNICQMALKGDFSKFPNPVQYNRSTSISNGEHTVRNWQADCGTAQSFAEKCFDLNSRQSN